MLSWQLPNTGLGRDIEGEWGLCQHRRLHPTRYLSAFSSESFARLSPTLRRNQLPKVCSPRLLLGLSTSVYPRRKGGQWLPCAGGILD